MICQGQGNIRGCNTALELKGTLWLTDTIYNGLESATILSLEPDGHIPGIFVMSIVAFTSES